jgi:hypothetical protein
MSGVILRGENLDIGRYRGKTMWRHREKMAIYKPRRKSSEETNPADTFISSICPTENIFCMKIYICCLIHPLCGTML